MKLLIATDAWLPQVNGVVRTMQATIAELERRGVTVRIVDPSGSGRSVCPPIRISASPSPPPARFRRDRGLPARWYPHQHRGTDRLGGALRLPQAQRRFTTSYHTRFRNMCGRARPCPSVCPMRCCGGFTLGGSRACRDSAAGRRARATRVPQHQRLGPRRRYGPVQAEAAIDLHLPRRSSDRQPDRKSRRTSTPSFLLICRAPRWSSAMARSWRNSGSATRRRIFSGSRQVRTLRRSMPPPTYSSFRA